MTKQLEAGLREARQRIEALAAVIRAPRESLPTYGCTEDGARPHIEFDAPLYTYAIVERGEELRRSTGTLDNVLEWVFVDIAHGMAVHHARGKDRFREVMFAHQLDLLGQLNPDWRARHTAEIETILKRAPLVDGR